MKKTIVVALVVSPVYGQGSYQDVETLTFNSYSEFKVNFEVYERNGWRLIEAKEVDFFYDLDQKEERVEYDASGHPYPNLDEYFKELMK